MVRLGGRHGAGIRYLCVLCVCVYMPEGGTNGRELGAAANQMIESVCALPCMIVVILLGVKHPLGDLMSAIGIFACQGFSN